jgi:hypothetical protein
MADHRRGGALLGHPLSPEMLRMGVLKAKHRKYCTVNEETRCVAARILHISVHKIESKGTPDAYFRISTRDFQNQTSY